MIFFWQKLRAENEMLKLKLEMLNQRVKHYEQKELDLVKALSEAKDDQNPLFVSTPYGTYTVSKLTKKEQN